MFTPQKLFTVSYYQDATLV